MSTTDGDASSRLDRALSDVLGEPPLLPPRDTDSSATSRHSTDPRQAGPRPADDWNVDDPDDFVLPEIVPATQPSPPDPQPTPQPARQPTRQPAPAGSPRPVAATPPATSPAPPATSWSDHMSGVPGAAAGAPLRAPGRRPRVRRVTRVVRHIDPWSTFKVALLFSFVAYLVALTSGVLLWRVADATGTLDNVERWFTQFGWETFELDGGEIFRNAWIIGLFGAVALTGALVLLATLFNLVSDIVGGVRLTVLEEEVVERTVSSTRRYVVRRSPAVATEPATTDWSVDEADDEASGGAEERRPDAAATSVVATTRNSGDDWSVDDDDDDDDHVDGAPPGHDGPGPTSSAG